MNDDETQVSIKDANNTLLNQRYIQGVSSKISHPRNHDESPIRSVVVKVKESKDGFSENFYITFNRVDVKLKYLQTTIKLAGIEILVSSTLGKYSTTLNFLKIRPTVEKAFRLLTLAFHETYKNLSPENQILFSDDDFTMLRSALIRLGVGQMIDFVYFYHPGIKESDEYIFQKELNTIFDEPEKAQFIKTGTERIDTRSDFSDFILLYDRSSIDLETLGMLKEYLEKTVSLFKVNYSDFVKKLKPSKSEEEDQVPTEPKDTATTTTK